MELRVGRKYRLGNKVGSGSFGEIYAGLDFLDSEKNKVFLPFSRLLEFDSRCKCAHR